MDDQKENQALDRSASGSEPADFSQFFKEKREKERKAAGLAEAEKKTSLWGMLRDSRWAYLIVAIMAVILVILFLGSMLGSKGPGGGKVRIEAPSAE